MRSRVGADRESAAIAELVLNPLLVSRLLDGLEATRGHNPRVGGVGEPGRRVGAGDVVADRAEVIRTQRGVRRASRQAHVFAKVVGQVELVLLGVQAQIGCVRVGGEFEVDQELVADRRGAAEEILTVVEGGINRALGVFHFQVQLGRCHQVRVRDVGADSGYRDPSAADLEAANSV